MRATIDRSVGMGYLYLQDKIANGGCAKSVEVQFDKSNPKVMPDLLIDLDKDGRVLGIEFFNAIRQMPQEVLNNAEDLMDSYEDYIHDECGMLSDDQIEFNYG
jgi:uncharacterized protein YuzE